MSFARVYLEMMKAGYAYGFVFPSELMLHAKALTTAETLLFTLDPELRFEEVARPIVAREFADRATSSELIRDDPQGDEQAVPAHRDGAALHHDRIHKDLLDSVKVPGRYQARVKG